MTQTFIVAVTMDATDNMPVTIFPPIGHGTPGVAIHLEESSSVDKPEGAQLTITEIITERIQSRFWIGGCQGYREVYRYEGVASMHVVYELDFDDLKGQKS